jgi:hypothetical protein
MSGSSTVTTVTAITAGPRGTPRYMPPEQWEGKPVLASDQYALAVMAYQLLTLHYPFNGEQILQLMYQHLQGMPDAPSAWNHALSPAVDSVILRALARKPSDRFPSIRDFAQALHQAQSARQAKRANQGRSPSTLESMPTEEAYYTATPTVPPRDSPIQPTLPPRERPAQTPLVLPANTSFSVSSTPERFERPVPTYPPARPVAHPGQQVRQAGYAPVPAPSSWAPSDAQFAPTRPALPLKARSRGKLPLVISLILLLVLAGSGGVYYYYMLRPQAQKHPLVHMTPTPVNGNANPYTNAMPTLRFSDPLSQPNMWQSLPYDQLTDGFCLFQQGAYHASSNKTHVYTLCPAAQQQPTTSDMTFEMQMQILHGDCGGLLFRGDFKQGDFYYFDVCFDGHYYLTTYKQFALLQQLPTQTAVLPALQKNAQALITIGVVAQGSQLTFFLDGQQVDQLTDSTYTSGQIALLCFAINNPTEVVFSNARLWTP